MATVTGLTKERMEAMEAATIIDGSVVGDNLILQTRGGTSIDAGSVRGPMGVSGSAFTVCTSGTRPSLVSGDEGTAIYETDTDLTRIWTGTRWKLQERVICTSSTRPAGLTAADEGVAIYETDTNSEYVWTGTAWQGSTSVPIGSVIEYYGSTEPVNWKFPNGQTISRTTYATLFGLFGTAYGAGDGSTFGLPDKRQRVGVMAGGALAVGAIGGETAHALTTGEMAAHTHGVTVPGGLQVVIGSAAASTIFSQSGANVDHAPAWNLTAGNPAINSAGSGTAHNNMQPYLVCNYLMRVL